MKSRATLPGAGPSPSASTSNFPSSCMASRDFKEMHLNLGTFGRSIRKFICSQQKRGVLMSKAVKRSTYFSVLFLFVLSSQAVPEGEARLSRTVPITLPESTAIHVTLNNAVGSDRSQPGDHFEATLSQPVVLAGRTVIPEGSRANGVVVDSRRSGRLVGHSHLQIALESVEVGGSTYEIRTATETKIGKRHGRHNFALIGGGAGTGLLIGALAAGGGGALLGGPIGAGVGTVAAVVTLRRDIRLPAETQVTFELATPATIEVSVPDFAGPAGRPTDRREK